MLPWEEARGFWGLLKALPATCRLVLFRPLDFFERLKSADEATLRKRLLGAVAFALVMGYIKLLLDAVQLIWLGPAPYGVFPAGAVSFLFLLRPVLILVVTLGVVFAGVAMVLGVNRMLLPALLVVCYRSAADIFYLIPFAGGIFAMAWSLVVIAVGLRQMYAVGTGRAVLAGIAIPLLVLLLIVVAAGPALTGFIFSFYPEVLPQWMAFNDLNAYLSTLAVLSAIETYHKDFGFYPARLAALDKYLESGLVRDAARAGQVSGYVYDYALADDRSFRLRARPQAMGQTGHFMFYADESGRVRLNGAEGPEVKGMAEMELLVQAAMEKPKGAK